MLYSALDGDSARLYPGGHCALHSETRDGAGSAPEGGAGVCAAGVEHVVSAFGSQHPQSHRAAAQTGRARRESRLRANHRGILIPTSSHVTAKLNNSIEIQLK